MSRFNDSVYPALPVFAQNAVCTAAGYLRFRSRFNAHFHETLASLERSIHAPLEELYEIQRTRLDRLVNRARRHVP